MGCTFTQELFLTKAKEKFGNKYQYLFPKKFNSRSTIIVICPRHGRQETLVNTHLSRKKNATGCPECGYELRYKNVQLTKEEFVERAKRVHGDKYDYSQTNYIGNIDPIRIVCKGCGEFETTSRSHLSGCGCGNCTYREVHTSQRTKQSVLLKRFQKVHGNVYDYSKVNYEGNKTKVEIVCKTHGSFWVSPSKHEDGQGCNKCRKENNRKEMEKSVFLRLKKIHKGFYDYSKSIYLGYNTKMVIGCPIHGDFKQTPNTHLYAKGGCPRCADLKSRSKISKASQKWLDSLNIKEREYRIPGTNYSVDGFDPKTNRIFEYLGVFWHGSPLYFLPDDINPISKKSYGQLYQDTMKRLEHIKSLGYKVVIKWEVPRGMKKIR